MIRKMTLASDHEMALAKAESLRVAGEYGQGLAALLSVEKEIVFKCF